MLQEICVEANSALSLTTIYRTFSSKNRVGMHNPINIQK